MDKITPTRKKAIELKCHDCMGNYYDGKMECQNSRCPLYAFMPYKKGEPNLSVFLYSPRAVGLVLESDRRRKVTDAQREAGKRLAATRRKKSPEKLPPLPREGE